MWKRLIAGSMLLAACAGNPNHIGLYTPIPRDRVWEDIERKVTELGYTVARSDRSAGVMVAEKPGETGAPEGKEEIQITVAPDATGVTKLDIVSARVLPATADRPVRRVAAGGRTSADANAILHLFMTTR